MKISLTLLIFITTFFFIITVQSTDSPFIKTGQIYQTNSQFQLNLILNQNRNFPIVVFVYSKDSTKQVIQNVLTDAFNFQSDIGFALLIDCRLFQHTLNGSSYICLDYKKILQQGKIQQEDQQDPIDQYFSSIFMAPSSIKIKQKGHVMLKQHQPIQQNVAQIKSQTISKFIQRNLPDFITTIEDNYQLNDFLRLNSDFSNSKQPKLIHFDSNLQSPPFLKKLGAKLYNIINIATCDNPAIAKKFGVQLQDTILLQYNFQTNSYDTTKIIINNIDHPVKQVQAQVKQYIELKRIRDILLDFQHRQAVIYNVSKIKLVNHLFSYGRVVLLQASIKSDQFNCPSLKKINQSNNIIFSYVCLKKQMLSKFLKAMPNISQNDLNGKILWMEGSVKNNKIIQPPFTQMWKNFNRTESRQKVSNYMQSQLCIRNAQAQGKQAIFYYFNQKTHQEQIAIVQYLNSLPQINSLIYFCKIYLPDKQIKKKLQIIDNSMFSLLSVKKTQQLTKFENKNVRGFGQIKMFVREIGIQKVSKTYEQMLVNNNIPWINSPQQLTKHCYNKKCVVGLIAVGKFRQERQIQILKNVKIAQAQHGLQFVLIDGICHFQIPKQLKFLDKKQKIIDRSYVFAYRQKDTKIDVWKSEKSWTQKQLTRWIKGIKNEKNFKKMKFGLDIEDKKCQKQKDDKKKQNQEL